MSEYDEIGDGWGRQKEIAPEYDKRWMPDQVGHEGNGKVGNDAERGRWMPDQVGHDKIEELGMTEEGTIGQDRRIGNNARKEYGMIENRKRKH